MACACTDCKVEVGGPAVIDLHCHFLPGIDDGAQSMDDALALARRAVADGIRHAVMTPHIHPGVFENHRDGIKAAIAQFRKALLEAGIALSVSLGAEIRLGPEVIQMIEDGALPAIGTLGGEAVVLLELPHGHIPVGTDRLVAWLRSRGYRPLIAHPERNKEIMRSVEKVYAFTAAGCLLQVTAGSLTGLFGVPAQTCALRLLEEELVFAVSTDAHNLEHRPPVLSEARAAIAQMAGVATADALTRINPARVIGLSAHTLAGPLQFSALA
jgi:protein-tyrosine phosphatase